MTREEAIDVLKHNYPSACFTDLCNAVEIAIQALSAQPEIIRCKDCKYKPVEEKYTHTRKMKYGFPDDVWVETIVKSPVDFSPCPCIQDDEYFSWVPDDDWFCANGERK